AELGGEVAAGGQPRARPQPAVPDALPQPGGELVGQPGLVAIAGEGQGGHRIGPLFRPQTGPCERATWHLPSPPREESWVPPSAAPAWWCWVRRSRSRGTCSAIRC